MARSNVETFLNRSFYVMVANASSVRGANVLKIMKAPLLNRAPSTIVPEQEKMQCHFTKKEKKQKA